MKKTFTVCLSLVALLISSTPAISHEVKPEDAANPIRVTAYVLYPVGYVLYQVVVRPLHGIISLPGARQLVGHKEDVFEQRIWSTEACKPLISGALPPEPQLQKPEKQAVHPESKPEELSPTTTEPQTKVVPQETPQPKAEEELFPKEQPAPLELGPQAEPSQLNTQPQNNKDTTGEQQ